MFANRNALMKRVFLFLLIILITFQQFVVLPGCANIIPPSGGPRDSIPPVLLKANPDDSARNFTGNKIVFTFDEFVEVQNIQENLIVSPIPKINPTVEYRLSTVTVKLKDSLEANTTYSLNFGNAIKDFTEGNAFKNFTYTFSTGNYIDSLELQGKVLLAESGKVDSSLVVVLHTNKDDSAVVKDKPRYIAKLDGKGNFVFRNLPFKTFYVYALKDEGGTLRYFSDKQLFAFADQPVKMQSQTEAVTLYAYLVKQAASQPVSSVSALNLANRRRSGPETSDKRLKYQTNLANNQQDLLSDFTITFEQPLRSFDSSKIRLYTDSIYTPVSSYSFQKDSTHKKIRLINTWKENTLYHFILEKNFAEDSSGKKLLKTDTLSFKTKKISEYGALKMKFRNLPLDKNPVLLFVVNENIYKSFSLTGSDFNQSLFLPGEYELRILYDSNKNGVWDPGEFFGKHKQPEIVKPVERKINVKPAWQNEFEIAL
ncbi:MAG: Ig-like domain-containing protein [Sphingobacteriales bacterium]|nr:Ig-like domain-containing protein [Sphingobacteriales bacterium]